MLLGGGVPVFGSPRPVSIGTWTAEESPATSNDVAGADAAAGSRAGRGGGAGCRSIDEARRLDQGQVGDEDRRHLGHDEVATDGDRGTDERHVNQARHAEGRAAVQRYDLRHESAKSASRLVECGANQDPDAPGLRTE